MCFFHVEDDFTLDYIVLGSVIQTLVSNITGSLKSYVEFASVRFQSFFIFFLFRNWNVFGIDSDLLFVEIPFRLFVIRFSCT